MKGIIFNVVEEAVSAEHGDRTWDALLLAAGLDGGYSSMGDYPDEELLRLVGAGAEALGVTPDELTRHLGHQALILLAGRYPHFFAPHLHTRDFLLTLNDVIHPEVRKLHANAHPPEFDFDTSVVDELVVGYRSERGLCQLADGMIGGAATVYGEQATVVHEACTHLGDPVCRLRCTFAPAERFRAGDLRDPRGTHG